MKSQSKNKQKSVEKRRSISSSMILMIVIISVIELGISILMLSCVYNAHENKRNSELAFQYTETLADMIDGDKVSGYLETGEMDAHYEEVQHFMDLVRKRSAIEYYYVVVPGEDCLIYVWDTTSIDGTDVAWPLGYEEAFEEGGGAAELSEAIMSQRVLRMVTRYRSSIYGYVYTAFSPVVDSEGKPVAIAAVDLRADDMEKTIMIWIISMAGCLMATILISMFFVYYILNANIVIPIQKMTNTAQEMIHHITDHEKIRMDIHVNNEIGDMAHSFETMYEEITTYIDKLQNITKENERIGTKLEVANQIKGQIIPKHFQFKQDIHTFDLYAFMDPAKEVGGDYYDCFLVDDDHLAISIGDVSGKGVLAAIFMVIANTLIKNYTNMGFSPEKVLEGVNNALCENNDSDLFTTAWLGIVNLQTGKVVYADARHERALRLSQNGEVEEIGSGQRDIALGIMEETEYHLRETYLKQGDTLLVYSDGVPKAVNGQGETFEMERLKAALRGKKQLKPKELLEDVKATLDEFVGDTNQLDDLTMLAVTFTPEA